MNIEQLEVQYNEVLNRALEIAVLMGWRVLDDKYLEFSNGVIYLQSYEYTRGCGYDYEVHEIAYKDIGKGDDYFKRLRAANEDAKQERIKKAAERLKAQQVARDIKLYNELHAKYGSHSAPVTKGG